MGISRRQFLESAAIGSMAARSSAGADISPAKTPLPTRVLGRTGVRVSVLAMGGGSRFLAYRDEDKALEALNRAFDLGITYMDTAYGYGNGKSEERVGKVMKTRRSGIFLATKIQVRDGDQAMRIIEGSLKRLQTQQIDLIHMHALQDENDLADAEKKGNLIDVLLKARDQKITRFIGVTSHYNPTVLKTALERHDFDCTQMALNAGQVSMMNGTGAMVPNPAMQTSFETVALPVARKKNLGVIAMKVFAQEALLQQAPVEKLMYYSLSLPGVSLATAGMPKLEMIEENVRLVKAFRPLPTSEMKKLAAVLSERNKAALDRRFAHHVDA